MDRKLTKLEMAGIAALQQNLQQAQRAFNEAVAEIGLDPAKNYHLEVDGSVTEEAPGGDGEA